ncbi:MAG: hypothetical protein NVS3B20_02260 [Polyangiales bacterium]
MRIPSDITLEIQRLFDGSERARVSELITRLWFMHVTVGADQLARSILVISEGRVEEVERIFASSFDGDPRDVVVEAERRLGWPGHYLCKPFEKWN